MGCDTIYMYGLRVWWDMFGNQQKDLFDIWFGQEIHEIKLPEQISQKIIHVDMDAFYASVEERDAPELKGKPVIVGGSPESRGVVCTANYKARKYGVRSAMPCFKAYQLCPHGVFLPPRFHAYKAASKEIRGIFEQYTNIIQPLSLDEAYLDVSNHQLTATEVAKQIQKEIFQTTNLTASCGVAPNKMLAKIASDMNKPNGIYVVKPHQAKDFIQKLPIKKIPGVGPSTVQKLKSYGIEHCNDVWNLNYQDLEDGFGQKFTFWLMSTSKGIDNRKVKPERQRKSYSSEHTFSSNVSEKSTLRETLQHLTEELCRYLLKNDHQGKTITLKLRYNDFKTITRSKTISHHTNQFDCLSKTALELFENSWEPKHPIRLIGVGISNLLIRNECHSTMLI